MLILGSAWYSRPTEEKKTLLMMWCVCVVFFFFFWTSFFFFWAFLGSNTFWFHEYCMLPDIYFNFPCARLSKPENILTAVRCIHIIENIGVLECNGEWIRTVWVKILWVYYIQMLYMRTSHQFIPNLESRMLYKMHAASVYAVHTSNLYI